MTRGRAALLERLADVPRRLGSASRVSGGRPARDGEWSAREVVRHLIAVEEEVWQRRLGQLAGAPGPAWSWTEPGLGQEPDARPLEDLLVAFAAERAATLERVRGLDEEGWARTGTHETFGVLDVAGLLHEALAHDEEHLAQLATGSLPPSGEPRV